MSMPGSAVIGEDYQQGQKIDDCYHTQSEGAEEQIDAEVGDPAAHYHAAGLEPNPRHKEYSIHKTTKIAQQGGGSGNKPGTKPGTDGGQNRKKKNDYLTVHESSSRGWSQSFTDQGQNDCSDTQ